MLTKQAVGLGLGMSGAALMQPMAGLPAMYLLRAASCTHPLQPWGVSYGRMLPHCSPALLAPRSHPWLPGARAEATGVAAHALVRFPAAVLAAGVLRRSVVELTGVTLPSAARRRAPVCAAATAESPTAQKAAPSLGTEVSFPVRRHACRGCTRRVDAAPERPRRSACGLRRRRPATCTSAAPAPPCSTTCTRRTLEAR
jgi:hypothetical protein